MIQSEEQGSASQSGKGRAFFERADEVAETGNYDFAVELYLEGIKREPDNIPRGHQKLREAGLRRKIKGGKPANLMEQFKHRGGKTAMDRLVKASYMLAKDPGSLAYMEQILQSALSLNLREVVRWISGIMLESQRQSQKPQRRILTLLIDVYTGIEDYGQALQTCQLALQQTPNDAQLADTFNDLSAKYTIKKGKYDQEGDFTKSVRDVEGQKELMQKDSLIQDESFLELQISRARQDYQVNPTVPGKINAYADALLKIEDQAHKDEAVNVLTTAYEQTGAYQFKMRLGDIKMRQMSRRYRRLIEENSKEQAAEHARMQLDFELEEFAERAVNYPTDLGIKFDLGVRQFRAGRYDEAIGSFQHTQRDPRRHVQSLNYLGMSFARKGWLPEAAQTLERAMDLEMSEELSKTIRYSLGDVYEQMNLPDKALAQFSAVAQLDFNYKDVRGRVENIRKQISQGGRNQDS